MRIHGATSKQCWIALQRAREEIGDSLWVVASDHGSRSHGHAVELALRSDNETDRPDGRRRRLPNFGTALGVDRFNSDYAEYAASYDEWGWVLAAIYEQAPDALCGSTSYPVYADREDFHAKTDNKFHPENPDPFDPKDRATAEKIIRNPERFSRAKVVRAKETIARNELADEWEANGLADAAAYVRKNGPAAARGYLDRAIVEAEREDELYHRGEGWELGNLRVARESL